MQSPGADSDSAADAKGEMLQFQGLGDVGKSLVENIWNCSENTWYVSRSSSKRRPVHTYIFQHHQCRLRLLCFFAECREAVLLKADIFSYIFSAESGDADTLVS